MNNANEVSNENINQLQTSEKLVETPNSQNTERSNTSLASDLTKNSRSDNLDKNLRKTEAELNEKPEVKVPKGALNEFQQIGNIKKTSRTFVPKEREKDKIIHKGNVQVQFLLSNGEKWTHNIGLHQVSEAVGKYKYITVYNKKGSKL